MSGQKYEHRDRKLIGQLVSLKWLGCMVFECLLLMGVRWPVSNLIIDCERPASFPVSHTTCACKLTD